MTDDELISLYVDGQLAPTDNAAFEERLRADTSLRRKVSATRLLMGEARQFSAMPVTRNFILPRDFGVKPAPEPVKPVRPLLPNWIFRLGSVAAAALFAVLVGADTLAPRVLLYSTGAPVVVPQSASAATQVVMGSAPAATVLMPSPMAAVVGTPLNQTLEATLAAANAASQPTPDVSAMSAMSAEAAPAPLTSAMGAPEARAAETNVQPSTDLSTNSTLEATPMPSMKSAPLATTAVEPAASAPTESPAPPLVAAPAAAPSTQAVEQQAAQPLLTPVRALAALSLIVALVFGVVGWAKRN